MCSMMRNIVFVCITASLLYCMRAKDTRRKMPCRKIKYIIQYSDKEEVTLLIGCIKKMCYYIGNVLYEKKSKSKKMEADTGSV